MKRTCLVCFAEFESNRARGWCDTECRRVLWNRKSRAWRESHIDRSLDIEAQVRQKRELNGKAKQYRDSRRKSKVGYVDRFMERVVLKTPDTDITRDLLEVLVEAGVCCITGVEFEYENSYDSYHNPLAPSIDRIDSKRGYYADNIQIILSCLNRFKNDLPNEDFLKLWKALTEK